MTRHTADGDMLAALIAAPWSLVDWPCPCDPMPRNYWHHPAGGGEWDGGREIAGGAAAANRDAAEYAAGGFDGWAIACPECRMVYATGWEIGP